MLFASAGILLISKQLENELYSLNFNQLRFNFYSLRRDVDKCHTWAAYKYVCSVAKHLRRHWLKVSCARTKPLDLGSD